jgi:hypothetical protein
VNQRWRKGLARWRMKVTSLDLVVDLICAAGVERGVGVGAVGEVGFVAGAVGEMLLSSFESMEVRLFWIIADERRRAMREELERWDCGMTIAGTFSGFNSWWCRKKSGVGPPHSRTLARLLIVSGSPDALLEMRWR